MNPTIALNEFTNFAEQDSRLFFGVQQAAQAHVRGLLVVLAWLLYPIFFILAQVAPFALKSHVEKILPVLPYIEDAKTLAWLRNAFLLYHEALKAYEPHSFFRRRMRSLIDELDEQIDSLTFVSENQQYLEQALRDIENKNP